MTKIQKISMFVVAAGALLTVGVAQAQDAPADHHAMHHHHKAHHHHKGHHHGHAAAMHHEDHAMQPEAMHNHDFDNLNR